MAEVGDPGQVLQRDAFGAPVHQLGKSPGCCRAGQGQRPDATAGDTEQVRRQQLGIRPRGGNTGVVQPGHRRTQGVLQIHRRATSAGCRRWR